MTTSITAFPITAKQIAELTSASSAAGTDYLMAQQGATGTAYRKMTVAQIMASGAAVLASGVTVNSATVPANGMYLRGTNILGLAVNNAGKVQLAASALSPITSDAIALGTTSLMWADLFLASGGVINFNAGNYTLTHSTGLLTASGALVVSGATTLSAALTYGGVTLSNSVTGTGSMVLSASPTLTGLTSTSSFRISGINVDGYSRASLQTLLTLDSSAAVGFAWNYSGGGGETDLFINRANGTIGGLNIYDFPSTAGDPTLIAKFSGAGALSVGPSGNTLTITPKTTSGTAITLVGGGTGGMTFATSGGVQVAVTNTASAVNYVSLTGGATGTGVTVSASGSNTDINLILDAKGTAVISALDHINLASGKVLQVNSTQVVGPRDTGWTAMTGTADEVTSYATSTVTLAQLAGRVMALQTALTTHGLIGA